MVLAFFRELTDAAIDVMAGHVVRTPSAETTSCVPDLGGAMRRPVQDRVFQARGVLFGFAAPAG
ncbi:hypothetical protein [Streptomyces bicolor]|uniref:hypothetical protein n=1 Tax=Streptomyces bicolor TaxID=66874 RepID=UPI0004E1112C|nr:hypothetical protein [Streptomyces bicolor]